MSEEEIQIKKILLPTDGSNASLKAAKYAVKIAKKERAQIICIHAVANPQYLPEYGDRSSSQLIVFYEQAKKLTQTWFRKVTELAGKDGINNVKTDVVIDVTSIADTILTYAINESVDLIVIGTKGRTGLKRFLLGSVANSVVQHAHCPVLVVR